MLSFVCRRGRCPRRRDCGGPAVALSVLVALGAIGLVGTLLGSQAATLARRVPQYVEAVQDKLGGSRLLPPLTSRRSRGSSARSASGRDPSVRPRGSRTDPAHFGRHTATAARRRARDAEFLECSRGGSERDRAGPWSLETTVIVLIVASSLDAAPRTADRFIRLFGSTDLHGRPSRWTMPASAQRYLCRSWV